MTIRNLSLLILILGVFSKNICPSEGFYIDLESDSIYSLDFEIEQVIEEEIQSSYCLTFIIPEITKCYLKIQNHIIERNSVVETPPPKGLIT